MEKILLYDIETAPLIGTTFDKTYEANIVWIIQDWYMLSFAWKWLGEKKIHVLGLDDFKLYKKDPENDKELVKKLHELFNEADVVIAHNNDQFDQKMSNTRFMVHKMAPPSPYKSIDTKKVAKRYARFSSNKLAELGRQLKLGQKLSTGGLDLWKAVMRGDPKAWKTMKRYNKQDVVLLEQLYNELLPWIDNHPPRNLLKPDSCPKCGEGPLHSAGWKLTKTRRYRRYQCQNCGGYSSDPAADKSIERPRYVN